MPRRLILLRHGLTPWNAEGRFQGQTDVELAETGHQQAKAAAVALCAEYDVARIVASDLARARQTADYLAEGTGLEVAYDARLRETHGGESQGLLASEVVARWGTDRPDYGAIGGESREAVGRRMAEALTEIGDVLLEHQTAVVVSHGGAMRQALARLLGWPLDLVFPVRGMSNCGWAELTSAEGGAWRLAAYNRVAPIS